LIERAAPGRNTSAQHIGATRSRQPLARQTPVWQRCGDDRPARADRATSARKPSPVEARLFQIASGAVRRRHRPGNRRHGTPDGRNDAPPKANPMPNHAPPSWTWGTFY